MTIGRLEIHIEPLETPLQSGLASIAVVMAFAQSS
jgi:hypothetical protein